MRYWILIIKIRYYAIVMNCTTLTINDTVGNLKKTFKR